MPDPNYNQHFPAVRVDHQETPEVYNPPAEYKFPATQGAPTYPEWHQAQSSTAPEVYYPVPHRDGGTDKEAQVEQVAVMAENSIRKPKKRIFWIFLIAVLIVIVAVGGGIGGALASKKSSKSVANLAAASGTSGKLYSNFYSHSLWLTIITKPKAVIRKP